jgi:integrase
MARGDGRLFQPKGSPFFHCAYFLRGVEHRESTKTADEQQARKFLKSKLRQVGCDLEGARKFTTPQMARVKVHDLVEDLRKDFEVRNILSSTNACHLNRLDRDFGSYKASELTAGEIKDYIQRCQAKGDKASTINRTTQMLGQSFNLAAIERGFTHKPHITRLSEKDNVRMGVLTEAEFNLIVAQLPEELKDMARFAHAVGLRRGEVLSLRWDCVEGDTIKLRAMDTKTKQPRSLPMVGKELSGILARRKAARAVTLNGITTLSPWIFFRIMHGQVCQIKHFHKAWKGAAKRAGFPNALFHDLRRCGVTSLMRAGTPAHVAMRISGHKSDAMLRRYDLFNDEDIRKALEQTDAYRAGLPSEVPVSNVIAMGQK